MTNKNIPTLRFPEFSGEWEVKKLGDIADISSGGTPSRTNTNYWNGNIPWVSTTLINFNTITKTDELITNEGLKNSSAKLFPIGTILMAMYGQGKTRGKVAMLGIEATTNQACGAIMAQTNIINSVFLFQNLFKRYDEIRDLSNQGGQENLSGGIIKSIDISFPILSEQTKIADFLSAVDKKLFLLKEKKSLLEAYKKGVMQKIFNLELRFKKDDGSDFEDWEEKALGEVTFKVDKKNKKNEILPVYSISNKNGFVHQSEQFDGVDSVERGYDTALYKIVESNTFVYNPARINVGSIGYSQNLERVIVSSLYVCFKTDNSIYDLFFNFFLQTKHFNKSVIRSSEGGVRDYLFYENFSRISINIPTLPEQEKIANFLSSIDAKIGLEVERINHLEGWKKGLLQGMFV